MKDKFHVKKNNWILLISIIFAIAFRSYFEWMLFDFGSDKVLQMATAVNLADGNGISVAYVSANDLAQIRYEKIGLWPPGYALGVAALIKIGFSIISGTLLLEIMSVLVLLFSFYQIFKLFKNQIHPIIPVSFFFFYGLSLQPFNILNSAGLLALSFFVLAFYFLLRIINKRNDLYAWFCLGLFSFLPSFFHFSYYPVSLSLPLLLLLYAYLFDTSLKKPAIINLLICGILISFQLFYQASLPTGISYLDEYHPSTDGAPYWENLTMFFNLPIYLLTDGYLLKRTIGEVSYYLFIFISSLAGLALVSALIIVKKNIYIGIKKEAVCFMKNVKHQFVIFSIILSWVVVIFMIFLSVNYPVTHAVWAANGVWTYVTEARYFAPVIITLPLAITIGLRGDLNRHFIKYPFLIIMVSGFLFSFFTNLYYINKYASGGLEENYGRFYHHDFEFDNYLEETELKTANYQLVYVQSSAFDAYAYYPKLKKIPVLKYKELKNELRTSAPVKLIFKYNYDSSAEDQIFIRELIDKYKLEPVTNFSNLNLATYELILE